MPVVFVGWFVCCLRIRQSLPFVKRGNQFNYYSTRHKEQPKKPRRNAPMENEETRDDANEEYNIHTTSKTTPTRKQGPFPAGFFGLQFTGS
jgi:hypothetical protein